MKQNPQSVFRLLFRKIHHRCTNICLNCCPSWANYKGIRWHRLLISNIFRNISRSITTHQSRLSLSLKYTLPETAPLIPQQKSTISTVACARRESLWLQAQRNKWSYRGKLWSALLTSFQQSRSWVRKGRIFSYSSHTQTLGLGEESHQTEVLGQDSDKIRRLLGIWGSFKAGRRGSSRHRCVEESIGFKLQYILGVTEYS